MRLFIVLVGTSALENARSRGEDSAKFASREPLAAMCAETATIAAEGWEGGDQVLLLASNTPDGRESMALIRERLENETPRFGRVWGEPVVSLDAGRVALEEGLRELGRHLSREIRGAVSNGQTPILVATGGYKAMTMMAAAAAYAHGARAIYIHRDFNETVRVPLEAVRSEV